MRTISSGDLRLYADPAFRAQLWERLQHRVPDGYRNGFLGTIVSDVPGTTRDAVDTLVNWSRGEERARFRLVDTAGIRRKGKTHLMAEKLSVVMARRHIRMAHVVLLVMVSTLEPVVPLTLALLMVMLPGFTRLAVALV